MQNLQAEQVKYVNTKLLTFVAITFFYFFEAMQMAYYNVLAPSFIDSASMHHGQVAALSAAYYYGDMIGLFPVGYALDRLPLRTTLIWALVGSIAGAFLLFVSEDFYIQWFARFICGFFGGTFSFLGGIRIIASVFPNRFSYFFGIFLAVGMFGGMICQYPLLWLIKHYSPHTAMELMFAIGVFAVLFSYAFLHPTDETQETPNQNRYSGSFWQMCSAIGLNLRNWCDVLMVVLLDTPVSIIGTLWGIVILTGFFHFTDAVASLIVMAMFAGLICGLPFWGDFADKRDNPPWIVTFGAVICFACAIMLFTLQTAHNAIAVAALFFAIGFFSSCQSIGFTWLTKNMQPELIGRNSAFNSVIFMGSNGVIKQLGASLLAIPAMMLGHGGSANLLLVLTIGMLIAGIYASIRRSLFDVVC